LQISELQSTPKADPEEINRMKKKVAALQQDRDHLEKKARDYEARIVALEQDGQAWALAPAAYSMAHGAEDANHTAHNIEGTGHVTCKKEQKGPARACLSSCDWCYVGLGAQWRVRCGCQYICRSYRRSSCAPRSRHCP
jgi:predicted nuclease with TOPRIM domain